MKKWQKLQGQQVLGMILPNIMGMMSGVTKIEQNKDGIVTLFYSDGSKESGSADYDLCEKEAFGIIGDIQAKSRKALELAV